MAVAEVEAAQDFDRIEVYVTVSAPLEDRVSPTLPGMLGLLLGLGAICAYIGAAISDPSASPGLVALGAMVVLGGGLLVGQFARVTVGICAMWAMLGALIAASIEIFSSEGPLAFAFAFAV